MSKDSETPPPGGQFLVYQTEDGKLKIDVRFEGETVWLTQQHMAELFQTTKQNIGQHLQKHLRRGRTGRRIQLYKESLYYCCRREELPRPVSTTSMSSSPWATG